MEDRVEAAEVHIAHLTRTVDELSDQVARQADQIDRLCVRFQILLDRLSKQDVGDASDAPIVDQRPPHW